ncbi:MAG: hypothetical protein ACK5PH_05435, partial [Inhella sp.]
YNVFMGLQYGTRTAAMMDVTDPRVAGTQFTAYMALSNVAIATAATWQGIAIDAWGYPITLMVDAAVGLLGLLLLPLIRPARRAEDDGAPVRRARTLCLGLGVLTLLWLPLQAVSGGEGGLRSILDTLFTLVFVAGALVLLAGRAMSREGGAWARWAPWAALGMAALALRRFWPVPAAPHGGPMLAWAALVLLGAVLLLWGSRQPWTGMAPSDGPAR